MRIQKADPGEASLLTSIAFEAKASWGYPAAWLNAWARDLTVTPAALAAHPAFLAFDEEERVGFALLEISGKKASLEHLWVRPTRMRRGIGRALFQCCEAAARAAGAQAIEIWSDPNAEGFYVRQGAVRIGEMPADLDGVRRSLPLLIKLLSEEEANQPVSQPPPGS